MSTVNVGWVQINNSFFGQSYLPLSVGFLQAYAQCHSRSPERYRFLPAIYRREPVSRAVRKLAEADLIGFSVYVWNRNLSLEIARRLKVERPDRLVVFGGPQVPDRAEVFLREHPWVDLVCHGEGETIFAQVLEHFPERDWTGIQALSYLSPSGRFVHQPRISRLVDLAKIPSPFLSGVFEPLMRDSQAGQWLGLWETNRGCPFSCAFCEWGAESLNRIVPFDMDRLQKEMEWFADHRIEFIFCCDANFGLLPRDVDIARAVARVKQERGYPHAFSIQGAKLAADRVFEIHKVLAESGMSKGALVALQSVNPPTLQAIGRANIPLETFDQLQGRLGQAGIQTFTDVIIGLPEETYDSFMEGVAQIIEKGQHNRIQFINLSLLGNAQMGNPDYQRKYGMRLVRSKIINIHGALESNEDDVEEEQILVVGTDAMPPEDWVRARVVSWMIALLYFDKLLQVPLVLLRAVCGIPMRTLLELFVKESFVAGSLFGEIREYFDRMARKIQKGGPEFHYSAKWLKIWWPTDEYIMIELVAEKKLDKFYCEAEKILLKLIKSAGVQAPFLNDAIFLNKAALKQFNPPCGAVLNLRYNIWELYRAAIEGRPQSVQEGKFQYKVIREGGKWRNIQDWCRQVVWYQNKKGAYLNSIVPAKSTGTHAP